MKNIATAFALIGLYHALERGFDGWQVQRVHTLLGRRKHAWPGMVPPDKSAYSLTVGDVLKAPAGQERDAMLRRWMRDVWNGWRHQHDWVRDISHTLLD